MIEAVTAFYNSIPDWLVLPLRLVLDIVLAVVLIRVIRFVINHVMKKSQNSRADTLCALMKNVASYLIGFFVLIQILQNLLGVSPASIIAAAGVFSVAIGFGAQSLVKDIIGGIFILIEDQYALGDLVVLDGFCGTIEDFGLRTTRVRSADGDLLFIPNGSISKVINRSRGDRSVFVQADISYGENIERAMQALEKTMATAKQELPALLETPKLLGVSAVGASGVSLRAHAQCRPGDQFMLERELLRRMKEGLEEAGIAARWS